ncbi:uncharacterized protein MONBRDRAFT_11026 [Monosiga brevicollis MX1]|uniref:Uncharacterized protein n=1 Tax=Monosiga brevicollis TaxID=81824 RepID=A9V802_MONBE|nr:uncharacterized protein MONBRDRAFT_11026 [Monosiga brevicollis MX1]EDQ86466.1 predicted protein [Monosiga brevicollis MX1]|eukprot:XP_001748856.1 hypothetical protein [Monosiga brevicollis MX1]
MPVQNFLQIKKKGGQAANGTLPFLIDLAQMEERIRLQIEIDRLQEAARHPPPRQNGVEPTPEAVEARSATILAREMQIRQQLERLQHAGLDQTLVAGAHAALDNLHQPIEHIRKATWLAQAAVLDQKIARRQGPNGSLRESLDDSAYEPDTNQDLAQSGLAPPSADEDDNSAFASDTHGNVERFQDPQLLRAPSTSDDADSGADAQATNPMVPPELALDLNLDDIAARVRRDSAASSLITHAQSSAGSDTSAMHPASPKPTFFQNDLVALAAATLAHASTSKAPDPELETAPLSPKPPPAAADAHSPYRAVAARGRRYAPAAPSVPTETEESQAKNDASHAVLETPATLSPRPPHAPAPRPSVQMTAKDPTPSTLTADASALIRILPAMLSNQFSARRATEPWMSSAGAQRSPQALSVPLPTPLQRPSSVSGAYADIAMLEGSRFMLSRRQTMAALQIAMEGPHVAVRTLSSSAPASALASRRGSLVHVPPEAGSAHGWRSASLTMDSAIASLALSPRPQTTVGPTPEITPLAAVNEAAVNEAAVNEAAVPLATSALADEDEGAAAYAHLSHTFPSLISHMVWIASPTLANTLSPSLPFLEGDSHTSPQALSMLQTHPVTMLAGPSDDDLTSNDKTLSSMSYEPATEDGAPALAALAGASESDPLDDSQAPPSMTLTTPMQWDASGQEEALPHALMAELTTSDVLLGTTDQEDITGWLAMQSPLHERRGVLNAVPSGLTGANDGDMTTQPEPHPWHNTQLRLPGPRQSAWDIALGSELPTPEITQAHFSLGGTHDVTVPLWNASRSSAASQHRRSLVGPPPEKHSGLTAEASPVAESVFMKANDRTLPAELAQLPKEISPADAPSEENQQQVDELPETQRAMEKPLTDEACQAQRESEAQSALEPQTEQVPQVEAESELQESDAAESEPQDRIQETPTEAELQDEPKETPIEAEPQETPAETGLQAAETEPQETPAELQVVPQETPAESELLESDAAETEPQEPPVKIQYQEPTTEPQKTPAEAELQAESQETPAEAELQAEPQETPTETELQAAESEPQETPAEAELQAESQETGAETEPQAAETEPQETPTEPELQVEPQETPAEEELQESDAAESEPQKTPAETEPQVEPQETPAEEELQESDTAESEPQKTPAEEELQESDAAESEPQKTPAETEPQVEPQETPAEEELQESDAAESEPQKTPAETEPQVEPQKTPAEEELQESDAAESEPQKTPAETEPQVEPQETPAEEELQESDAAESEPQKTPAETEPQAAETEPQETPTEPELQVEPQETPAEEELQESDAAQVEPQETPAESELQAAETEPQETPAEPELQESDAAEAEPQETLAESEPQDEPRQETPAETDPEPQEPTAEAEPQNEPQESTAHEPQEALAETEP